MILIGTDEGIYRWSDGQGWPVFHALQDRAVVGLAAAGPARLVALDRKGTVLETEDNGLSWRILPLPKGATAATALGAAGNNPPAVVAAVRPIGLFRREIGAQIPVAGPPAVPAGSGFAPVAIHRARGLARVAGARLGRRPRYADETAVERAGWTLLGAPPAPKDTVAPRERGLAVTASEIRSVVGTPTEPLALYAAVSGSGLWASGDGGASWARCDGLPDEVYAVRPVPGRPGHLWAATQDGCRFSADGGKTWEDRSAGLENARHVRAIEVKPGAPDTLLAGAAPAGPIESQAASTTGLGFALYESTSGGKTWAKVRKNLPDTFEADTITDVRFDPAAPDNALLALGSGELWLTPNGGAYWGPIARQIRAARVLCVTP